MALEKIRMKEGALNKAHTFKYFFFYKNCNYSWNDKDLPL